MTPPTCPTAPKIRAGVRCLVTGVLLLTTSPSALALATDNQKQLESDWLDLQAVDQLAPARESQATTGTPSARPQSAADNDGDGVSNSTDDCPSSPAGFPTLENGCALLDGVLTGVTFQRSTADLKPGATEQLDFLANVLKEFPEARIELHAHSDNLDTIREQSILTRARLRTIGLYLVDKGIRANRLVLRSFGGSRPLYNNNTAKGRADNNRIEVIEHIR